MHPIERLRHVARGGELDLTELVQDAALALAGFADDPAGLVTACRSLVDRHPAAGPVWWLAARVLTSADPAAEAWQVVEEVESDGTSGALYRSVPDGARVLTVGWTRTLADGLAGRGDCRVLVVDPTGAFGGSFGRSRRRGGGEIEEVPEAGIGAAAAWADLVVVEAQAMGPGGLLAAAGARAALAVAADAGRQTWSVVPVGRVLPEGLWRVLAGRIDDVPEPWLEPDELVPLGLVTGVVRESGLSGPDVAAQPDCPFAPELCRPLDAPGSHR